MSRVHTEFTSDTSKAERGYHKLHRETVKLREENKRLAQQCREGGKVQGDVANKWIGDAGRMVAGYFTISSAVGLVTNAYSEWRREMEKLGEASEKLNKSLLKTLSAAGDLAQAPKVAAFINEGSHGLTREQALETYGAVSEHAETADLERRQALTTAVGRAQPLQIDLKDLAALAGEFAQAMPQVNPADVADLALAAHQLARGNAGQLADNAFQKGMGLYANEGLGDSVDAIAFGLKAMEADLSPKFISEFSTKVGNYEAPKVKGRRMTADEALQTEFAALDDRQKMSYLAKADDATKKAILGDKLGAEASTMDFAGMQKTAEELRAKRDRDYVGEQLGLAGQTEEGREAINNQAEAVKGDQGRRHLEGGERARARRSQMMEDAFDAHGTWFDERWYQRYRLWAAETYAGLTPWEESQRDILDDAGITPRFPDFAGPYLGREGEKPGLLSRAWDSIFGPDLDYDATPAERYPAPTTPYAPTATTFEPPEQPTRPVTQEELDRYDPRGLRRARGQSAEQIIREGGNERRANEVRDMAAEQRRTNQLLEEMNNKMGGGQRGPQPPIKLEPTRQ